MDVNIAGLKIERRSVKMYTYSADVVKIIDGDTIDVNIHLGFNVILYKQRIRLMGIDTPESRTRNLEEKKRGLISKQYVVDKCPVGSRIVIESLDRGKFGRILGNIWETGHEAHPDTSINKRMIADGFAVEYFGGNKDALEAAHMKNKEILIEKGLLEPEN
jgi:micrococcal nuclease